MIDSIPLAFGAESSELCIVALYRKQQTKDEQIKKMHVAIFSYSISIPIVSQPRNRWCHMRQIQIVSHAINSNFTVIETTICKLCEREFIDQ